MANDDNEELRRLRAFLDALTGESEDGAQGRAVPRRTAIILAAGLGGLAAATAALYWRRQ